MSVGDETVDVLSFRIATTVASDFFDSAMLLAGMQYMYVFYCILPGNIVRECMTNVKYGLSFVWFKERIRLLDYVLSVLPAWLGFDTV